MSNLYNQRTVATDIASVGDDAVVNLVYKGFSSKEKGNNFKLYDIDLVKQDILNHFYIRKGEKLENPSFGTIIWDVLFEPFTPAVKKLIADNVEEIINYDPRVVVNKVAVDSTDDGIRIEADLSYLNFNVTERISFNFDRDNGIIN